MASLKFYVRTSRNNIPANIRIRLSISRKQVLYGSTNKIINAKYWDNGKCCVKKDIEFKEAEELQKELNKLNFHILNEINETSDKSKINKDWLTKTIDKLYNPEKYEQGEMTLFKYIQNFINNSNTRINTKTGNAVCYKMRREYQRTFDLLKEFAGKNIIDFNNIDLEFYQKFIEFLRIKKLLRKNTVGKKIQTLKIFLNAATSDNINKNNKYKNHAFATLKEESDSICLTKEELKQLYNKDLKETLSYERVRDLFIIGCCTGLRYSDLQSMTAEHIKGEFLEIRQHKTGHKVVIPIQSVVKEILKKYNGQLPKSISNQKYNDYLKKAAKLAEINAPFMKKVYENGEEKEKNFPKHELISSHTARRTFCTNAYKDNIPTITIMAISGHKTEAAFLKYIKVSPMEHAKIMAEVWRKNGDFLTI